MPGRQPTRPVRKRAGAPGRGITVEVMQLGGGNALGFFGLGDWYWTRVGANGFPDPNDTDHGAFFCRSQAVRAAKDALGDGIAVVAG